MPEVTVLEVRLYGDVIGTITRVQGDRNLFAFTQDYVDNLQRPRLGLAFKDTLGELITEFRPTQTRLTPFFANMLPEEHLRAYLAERAGVNPKREFFLLWALGQDLPGAVTITPADGDEYPQDDDDGEQPAERAKKALRFSLAGVQLKFSAVSAATGGLTIPAHGTGGSWIVKLPSQKYSGVPENEFSMMSLAAAIGIDVPELKLIELDEIEGLPEGIGELRGPALAVKRFDRTQDGGTIHIEDFAQVFNVYPEDKYKKASAKNIAEVLAAESTQADIAEFIRRLTFNTLIGNADMHLKNWSLIYPDRRSARLAPAYDFVATTVYIPDEKAALKFGRTKRFDEFNLDELSWIAGKARMPEKLVLDTAKETVQLFMEVWPEEQKALPLTKATIEAIDAQIKKIPLVGEA